MIPYQDLVAALRSWRERNGLPNFGTAPDPSTLSAMAPPMAPPMAPMPSMPPQAAYGARTAPPGPPPGAGVMELEDEIEAHEIESEEIYENEGSDFAMAFSANPAHTPPPPPGYATDPGSKFPGGTGYTDPGRTDPDTNDRFGSSTYDDDFASEPAPAAASGGTKPGIAVGKDVDTADETLVADDDIGKPGKKPKKKKR